MNINNLRAWIHLGAETLDCYRIVPRALITAFGFMLWNVTSWYMELPDPSSQQAALLTTVWGAGAFITNFYLNSGHSWTEGFKPWQTKKPTTTEPNVKNQVETKEEPTTD